MLLLFFIIIGLFLAHNYSNPNYSRHIDPQTDHIYNNNLFIFRSLIMYAVQVNRKLQGERVYLRDPAFRKTNYIYWIDLGDKLNHSITIFTYKL